MRSLALILLVYLTALPSLTRAAGESEVLLGYIVGAKGVNFHVISNGCTQAKDFTFIRQIGDPVGVELIRKIPDLCERDVRQGMQISFTFAEMELRPGARFTIANKLQTIHTVPTKP